MLLIAGRQVVVHGVTALVMFLFLSPTMKEREREEEEKRGAAIMLSFAQRKFQSSTAFGPTENALRPFDI